MADNTIPKPTSAEREDAINGIIGGTIVAILTTYILNKYWFSLFKSLNFFATTSSKIIGFGLLWIICVGTMSGIFIKQRAYKNQAYGK